MEASAISWTIFWVICFLFILPAVYSLFCSGVLDCFPAIHQGTAFHYLVQSAETEKGFWGGMAHSSSTNSLFSSTEMFLVFFTLWPGSLVIRRVSEIINATRFSNDPVISPDFLALPWFFHEYHVKTEPKDFHIINNDKALHLHSSADSLILPLKISISLIFTFSRYPPKPQVLRNQ